jgi:hypothetical protein
MKFAILQKSQRTFHLVARRVVTSPVVKLKTSNYCDWVTTEVRFIQLS